VAVRTSAALLAPLGKTYPQKEKTREMKSPIAVTSQRAMLGEEERDTTRAEEFHDPPTPVSFSDPQASWPSGASGARAHACMRCRRCRRVVVLDRQQGETNENGSRGLQARLHTLTTWSWSRAQKYSHFCKDIRKMLTAGASAGQRKGARQRVK
jgi:hypothetical protein